MKEQQAFLGRNEEIVANKTLVLSVGRESSEIVAQVLCVKTHDFNL